MKFLKNTATDLFAHSARFVNNVSVGDKGVDVPSQPDEEAIKKANAEAINEGYKQKEINGVLQWMKESCTKLSKEVRESFFEKFYKEHPEKDIYSTPKQNIRGDEYIEEKKTDFRTVKSGDTLGPIVMGLTGDKKLDYSLPVLYKSNKISPKRRAKWQTDVATQETPCFKIPPNIGIAKEEFFGMDVANLIYPGQVVYIKDGVIVIDDKEPSSDPLPKKEPPQKDIPLVIDDLIEEEDAPPVDIEKIDYEGELPPEMLWNGGEHKMNDFLKMHGNAMVSVEEAQAAYNLLYGKQNTKQTIERDGKTLEVNVERDGVYVVLEKYLNPSMKVSIWQVVQDLTNGNGKDLVDAFDAANYDRTIAENFVKELQAGAKKIHALNLDPKQLDNKDEGATTDFVVRTMLGAVVAGATLGLSAATGGAVLPAGLAIESLFAGAPILKLNTGVDGHTKVISANEVYEMFRSDPTNFKKNIESIGALTAPESYTELHAYALATANATTWLGNDLLGANSALMTGPDSENPIVKPSKKQAEEYEEYEENAEVVDEKMNELIIELMKMNFDILKGVINESEEAAESDGYQLKDGPLWGLLDNPFAIDTEQDLQEMLVEKLPNASPEEKKKISIELMNLYIKRFNENSEGLMESEWKDKLTLGKDEKDAETLNKAFENGEKFHLGAIGEENEKGFTPTLDIKFTSEAGFEKRIATIDTVGQTLEKLKEERDPKEMLSDLDVVTSLLAKLDVSDVKERDRITKMIMGITESIVQESIPQKSRLTATVDMLNKVTMELNFFKEAEKAAVNITTDHQGVKGTWEVTLKEQTNNRGTTNHEVVRATFDPKDALEILTRNNPAEMKERLGISEGMLTNEERELLIEKLAKSIPMIGHLTQLSHLKDLLNLSQKYSEAQRDAEEIGNNLAPSNVSESVDQRKYRVSVVSMLNKFDGWEEFGKAFGKDFPRSKGHIERYYQFRHKDKDVLSDAVNTMVKDPVFQQEMATLAHKMAETGVYMKMDDYAEVVKREEENTFVSGDTAVSNSGDFTVSYGMLKAATLAGKALGTHVEKELIPGERMWIPGAEGPGEWIQLTEDTIIKNTVSNATSQIGTQAAAMIAGGVIVNVIKDAHDNAIEIHYRPKDKEK